MLNRPQRDHPTKDELVDQLKESVQDDKGPNEVLRRHIEMFSRYSPLFRNVGYTIIGALVVPLIMGFLLFQLSPLFNNEGSSSEVAQVKALAEVSALVAVESPANTRSAVAQVSLTGATVAANDLSTLRGSIFHGLLTLVVPLFVCLVLARALKPGGLTERYFNWAPRLCSGLRVTIETLIWVCLPLRFFYTCLETFNEGEFNNSLGRILFIGAMCALTYGFWLTSKSLRKWIAASNRSNVWFDGMRNLLLVCLPIAPATLAVISALGYHFTAVEMSMKTIWTILMVVGISMVAGFVSRLLLIAQFGIKLRQLQRTDDGEIKNEESIDINEITTQVNRLLRATALVCMALVGWQFWNSVIPSIDLLDNIQLWVSAVGVAVITFILSRNLPGLLEITLLDRLPLDRGGRYAISFIVKYMVGLAGLFLACQIVGFSWTSVQWLAGALMVGLGFGLQEIFANIVSGIIILIERPIRVGDVVTVNNTTGTVIKMALRATTIKDRDYRELIVPNKKFITEDVMNWTLTDRKSRLVFRVGVAYGSDTELVERTLMKVANRHPLVNAEPKPEVVLDAFGDSTINFELRTVIPSRDIFAKVQHEMNMAIEAEFKAKGIVIAFPQQDIYIKNLKDLPFDAGPRTDKTRKRSEGGRPDLRSSPAEAGAGGSISAYLEPMELGLHDPTGRPVGVTSATSPTFANVGDGLDKVQRLKDALGESASELFSDAEDSSPPPTLKIFSESENSEAFQSVQQKPMFELVSHQDEPDSEFEQVTEYFEATESSVGADPSDNAGGATIEKTDAAIEGPRRVVRFPLKQVRGGKDSVVLQDRRAA